MEIKLIYVIGIKKSGGRKGDRVLYYWHRKSFSLRRLPDELGNSEMVALVNHLNEEADAERVVAETKTPGTFGRLVDDYLYSPEAEGLAPRTLKNYEYWLRRLEKNFGDLHISGIDREFVRELRNSMRNTPSAANVCIEVLRMCLGWAVDNGKLATSPALNPGRLKVKRRHAVWDDDAEQRFLEHTDDAMRLAYYLGAPARQRLCDDLGSIRRRNHPSATAKDGRTA